MSRNLQPLQGETLTDEQLASRAQAGSMPAFVELVARFEKRLFNFIVRRIGNNADAEDLTQETLLTAWRQIDRYRTRHRFSTWIYTIASRLAIDLLRSRALANKAIASGRLQPPDDARQSHHHDSSNAGAVMWRLAAEVLPQEQHAALWLRYAEDLSNREIACVLRRSTISVRVMIHRSLRVLQSAALTDRQWQQVSDHLPSRKLYAAVSSGGVA